MGGNDIYRRITAKGKRAGETDGPSTRVEPSARIETRLTILRPISHARLFLPYREIDVSNA